MKIAVFSDTHGYHRLLTLPDADMAIFAGDFSMRGGYEKTRDFTQWLGALPYETKVAIAGNHDIEMQTVPERYEPLFTKAGIHYLRDELIVFGGVRIYGSPYTSWFHGDRWAFNLPQGKDTYDHWKQIPKNLDVLVTHGPPNRILDSVGADEYAGDPGLAVRLAELSDEGAAPNYHVFGHIHEGHGRRKVRDTEYLNVSVLNLNYDLVNPVQVIKL